MLAVNVFLDFYGISITIILHLSNEKKRSVLDDMLNATAAIVFIIIFALEATIVIIGNVFTIFVFHSQSGLHLKRTSLLLINLAVADLLVGVGEVVVLVVHRIPRTGVTTFSLPWSIQTIGSCVSVMFLALISLERVYAVFWPLRHRVTSVRAYILCIVIVWVAGLCIGGLSFLAVYHSKVDSVYALATCDVLLFFCLAIMCASYLSIRSRLSETTPELQVFHTRSTRNQNLRLSTTFSIVVAVSLIFWLPGFVVYAINAFCSQCFSPTLLWLVNALHLANSMVNPFVYSFRMKIFKDALEKCCKKTNQSSNLRVPSVSRQ